MFMFDAWHLLDSCLQREQPALDHPPLLLFLLLLRRRCILNALVLNLSHHTRCAAAVCAAAAAEEADDIGYAVPSKMECQFGAGIYQWYTLHTSHVTRHTSHVTRHTSHVTRHTSLALPGVSSNPARLFRGQGDAADVVMCLWHSINFPASVQRLEESSTGREGPPPRKRQQVQQGAATASQAQAVGAFEADCDSDSSGCSSSDDGAEQIDVAQARLPHRDGHWEQQQIQRQDMQRPVWRASSVDAATAAALYMSAAAAVHTHASTSVAAHELPVFSAVAKGARAGTANEDAAFVGEYADDAFGSKTLKAGAPQSLLFWQRVGF
jgi:hypothetical protein